MTCDRNKAKKLLKLAMGVSTVERGPSDLVHGLKPIQPKFADNGEPWPAEMPDVDVPPYLCYSHRIQKREKESANSKLNRMLCEL